MTGLTTKKVILLVCGIFLLSTPHILFGLGKKDNNAEAPQIIVISDLQDRYNALSTTVPGVIMLPPTASSAVPADIIHQLGEELARKMVNDGKLRPVLMQQWLAASYAENKAASPFALINAIRTERYTVPLQYICRPYVFKSENFFGLTLDVYPLVSYYPVTVFRFFTGTDDLANVLAICLDELYLRLFIPEQPNTRKRVIVQDFKLDFLKLVTLESGEFEFIPAPFIAQHDVALRDGDDYFSRVLGYTLTTTDLFQVFRPADFADFAAPGTGTGVADYIIQGRVQLSAEMSVLYVDLFDARGMNKIVSLRYPLEEFSIKNIWDAYRDITTYIVSHVYDSESFGIVPALTEKGRGFYANNMFVGWDSLENFILPKGMHTITTGSYYRSGTELLNFERETNTRRNRNPGVGTFYVFLDTLDHVFYDREGEYAWNLLKK
jgi:hypothetical protein